jgi:hypothetical protein
MEIVIFGLRGSSSCTVRRHEPALLWQSHRLSRANTFTYTRTRETTLHLHGQGPRLRHVRARAQLAMRRVG